MITQKKEKRWLEVYLLIPADFGDAISNFLMEQGATGTEEVGNSLQGQGLKTYFPLDGKERKVLLALRRYLKSLQDIFPGVFHYQIESGSIPEKDWGEKWKRFFKPVRVTPRIIVKPPWSPFRLKKGQILVEITPGIAFGTGTHATTRLCVQALEERLQKKGLSVLDVGTGSGILSIVAAKLGAREVWGVDIDGMSVEIASENVQRSGLSNIVRIREGRIGDIRKRFDVVVANIDYRGLKRMRWPLPRHLESHGFLILSGVLEEEKDSLWQLYQETGLFRWGKVAQEEGWVCVTFKKR